MLHGTKYVQLRQVEFYKSLYSTQFCNSKEKEDDFFNHVDKTLNDVQNIYMNADLSIEETGIAIKAMKNNKSPRPDGIPAEFYKIYWSYIKHDLSKIYTKGLEDKELAYSQYLALITFLYKKRRREDIQNWRPISLFNVDYKTLSKTLAIPIKNVLPSIVHEEQRGCIQGRNIGQIIRNTEDVLHELGKATVTLLFWCSTWKNHLIE